MAESSNNQSDDKQNTKFQDEWQNELLKTLETIDKRIEKYQQLHSSDKESELDEEIIFRILFPNIIQHEANESTSQSDLSDDELMNIFRDDWPRCRTTSNYRNIPIDNTRNELALCSIIYNHKYKFLPLLKEKFRLEQTFNVDEEYQSLSDKIEDLFKNYEVEDKLTEEMRTRSFVALTDKQYPAIYLYTSGRLFRNFMVPGNFDKLQSDMLHSADAYEILICELKILSKLSPDLVVKSGQLFRSELWDQKKLQLYQKKVDEYPVTQREYKECAPVFSTSTSKAEATNFSVRGSVSYSRCLITYEIVSIDEELLNRYKRIVPDRTVEEDACVNISKYSLFTTEREVLIHDDYYKKIIQCNFSESNRIQIDARVVLINAHLKNLKYDNLREQLRERSTVEYLVLDAICNMTLLKHLALTQPQLYKKDADSLENKINRFFSLCEFYLSKLLSEGVDEIVAHKLSRERMWQQIFFHDNIVKQLDVTSLPLLNRLAENLPILLEKKCQEEQLRNSCGPVLINLLNGLIVFAEDKDKEKLELCVRESHRELCLTTGTEMTGGDELGENVMMDVLQCLVDCGGDDIIERSGEEEDVNFVELQLDMMDDIRTLMVKELNMDENRVNQMMNSWIKFMRNIFKHSIENIRRCGIDMGRLSKDFFSGMFYMKELMLTGGQADTSGRIEYQNEFLKLMFELMQNMMRGQHNDDFAEVLMARFSQQPYLSYFIECDDELNQIMHKSMKSMKSMKSVLAFPILDDKFIDPIFQCNPQQYRQSLRKWHLLLQKKTIDTSEVIKSLLLSLFCCSLINIIPNIRFKQIDYIHDPELN